MKIGLQIPRFDWPGNPGNIGARLVEIARRADEGGFASLWVMDHFFGIGFPWSAPETSMLEGYSTVAYMAAVTQRLRLGLMVTGAVYRHPGVLIKTVSTLDVLSGGRAYFGIGASWYEREAKGLGIPFPPLRERMERLEETLQIAEHMWSGNMAPFAGKYTRLEEPLNQPQPLSRPHPPILIGGAGEKQTLRMVATYGDACNFHLGAPLPDYPEWAREAYRQRATIFPQKLAILQEHCHRVGRAYEEIEKTLLGSAHIAPGAMSVEEVIEACHELAEMGFQQIIYNMPDVHEFKTLDAFAEKIIPCVSAY